MKILVGTGDVSTPVILCNARNWKHFASCSRGDVITWPINVRKKLTLKYS